MAKKETYSFAFDPVAALRNAPKLMGMELRQCGPNKLCGGYYLNGDIHQWRRDKIKVFISRGSVWVAEEGGRCISLPQWLIEFGHCADYKDAIRVIKGQSQAIDWGEHQIRIKELAVKYVSPDVLMGCKKFDLNKCTLFRWFCSIFPEDKVREAFDKYNVTTDSNGLAVFWSVDQNGRILHDKRMRFKEDGHRDKDFGGTRVYKTADGYSARCFFGSHLIQDNGDVLVVESERTALALYLVTGKIAVATAGKNNLREKDERFLCYPDKDSFEEWENSGNRCVRWFEDWELPLDQQPRTADVLDMIEWRYKNGYCLYL